MRILSRTRNSPGMFGEYSKGNEILRKSPSMTRNDLKLPFISCGGLGGTTLVGSKNLQSARLSDGQNRGLATPHLCLFLILLSRPQSSAITSQVQCCPSSSLWFLLKCAPKKSITCISHAHSWLKRLQRCLRPNI